MKVGNCLIAQSGGPSAAINATLAGVYSSAKKNSIIDKIYGGMNGIEGIIKGKLVDLSPILDKDDNLNLLKVTPASFLGSCRYKLNSGEKGRAEFEKIFKVFQENNIKYFFYIGGNDSMDTILQLQEYQSVKGGDIAFIGVPKTIDNDLMCIDHTPGFGSAAKYIATSVKEIAADIITYDMDCVIVVEVMGRNAGWLALSAALARDSRGKCMADLIYLPENAFEYDKLIEDIKKVQQTKRQIIVVVSEGIRFPDGSAVAAAKAKDSFGHARLGGVAKQIEAVLQERMGIKVRTIELSVLQRSAAHLLSATDIKESFTLGEKAVEVAAEGKSGVMITTQRVKGDSYGIDIGATEIGFIANKEKTVPRDYMNDAKNGATQKALNYLMPLIQGEIACIMENGVPKHLALRYFL